MDSAFAYIQLYLYAFKRLRTTLAYLLKSNFTNGILVTTESILLNPIQNDDSSSTYIYFY